MLEMSARRPLALAACAVTTALALLLGACSSEQKRAAPAPAPTPIARLNTTAMQVPRIEFCPLVPSDAVRDALAGTATSKAAYGNGDEEQLPGVGQDVVHEIGCSWTGADGTVARAWVFASPVTPVLARTVITDARRTPGCRPVPGAAFGTPTSTQVCQLPGGHRRVRHAGLFGQTWLSCEVAATGVPRTALRSRTDAWCVEIANALNTAH